MSQSIYGSQQIGVPSPDLPRKVLFAGREISLSWEWNDKVSHEDYPHWEVCATVDDRKLAAWIHSDPIKALGMLMEGVRSHLEVRDDRFMLDLPVDCRTLHHSFAAVSPRSGTQ